MEFCKIEPPPKMKRSDLYIFCVLTRGFLVFKIWILARGPASLILSKRASKIISSPRFS